MTIRRDDADHTRDRWHVARLSPWTAALRWIHDCGDRAAWALAGASVLLFFYTVYAFPNARLIAKQQEQEAMERESRAFCEKHAMPFGTREHTLCAAELMDIRANERQRTLAGLGIF